MIRASVVISTRNRRALLVQTLAGLVGQTLPRSEFEVVVALDGCTDDSADAVAGFVGRLPVRVVAGPAAGVAAARNLGSAEARAPVLVFLDDDQVAQPELLEAHLAAHARWPDAVVQGFYPVAPGRLHNGITRLYDLTYRRSMQSAEAGAGSGFTLWGGNFSIGRDLWAAVGGCDTLTFADYGCEDADLGLRAVRAGGRLVFEPRARTDHLHACGYRAFRRQALQEGSAAVRLAARHGRSTLGDDRRRRLTATVIRAWRLAPPVMEAAGTLATGALWVCDRLPAPGAQVAVARAVRKVYLAGGVAAATGAP